MNTITTLDDLPTLAGLVLLIGPPGSGKSTFAKKLIDLKILERNSYISNDEIAKQMFGVTTDRGDKDGKIFAEQDRRITSLLEAGKTAIVDATNVKPEARQRLISIAQRFNSPITALCFRRSGDVLLRQNRSRNIAVPEGMVLEYAQLMKQVTPERLQSEGVLQVFEVSATIA